MVDHGKSTKRKKFHDKDKYYKLAKEQGLRSRAAFKLTQINRQHPILDTNTKVVLDLCAAPGGWTQVASRICGSQTKIVAVDILAIRNLNKPNITTIVGDITTQKCKADIAKAIAPNPANVVLHDGAPNIGSSYEKDAYQQLELAVHALRCATQHLKKGGTFVTKIYRSRDSASFQWVVQQLFKEVTVFKPKASRQQSAEIFYVCQGYYKPDKIDPRLLDPKHIFEFVEGDTTGGGNLMGQVGDKFNVFHKAWDKHRRQRDGYNPELLDGTMRHIQPLTDFVLAKGKMDAIKLLSTCTGFAFQCESCTDKNGNTKKKSDKNDTPCHCKFLLNHPLTTQEIKECAVDLKVLNKGDFKGLMLWREKMIQSVESMKGDAPKTARGKKAHDSDNSDDSDEDENGSAASEDEDEIQQEIQELRKRKLREQKKLKKKERKLMAKKRKQSALGMDLNAIEVQEDDQFFSLKTLQSGQDLKHVAEVNLDKVTDEQAFGAASDDEDDGLEENVVVDEETEDEKTAKKLKLELELDAAYERYLETTKNGAAKSGTKAAKRSKKLMREKLAEESHQDHEMLLLNPEQMSQDARAYAEMLAGKNDADSDDDESSGEEDDDGFHDDPLTPEEHARKKQKKEEGNPLIHKFADEPSSVKTARWFSNPLFANIGEAVNSEVGISNKKKKQGDIVDPLADEDDYDDMVSEEDDQESDEEVAPKESKARSKQQKKTEKKESSVDPDDILAMMPKTEKQKRHEKRLKALARDERRQARKAKRLGESEGDFALAPREDGDEGDDDDGSIDNIAGMTPARKQKLLEARKLIKAGMGQMKDDSNDRNSRFEVVQQGVTLPVMDERKYDSENEEYDSDDYAKTMALGTMMLRKSKAKALVDASYNRFAWNDPQDLPEWFIDDENRHYRPQLPIPEALLAKMKEKQLALSTRPIAKVAEARARKNRKAKLKLSAAKKKAEAVANSSEMSEAMKLKSISKALRSNDTRKGKELVVAKKGRGGKGVKGGKVVDKRMKNDKRAMERATKKKKGGKKGGLTGSKKRRHHS